MKTENKLLKDDIKNKQKLIYAILEHNSNLIQAWCVFAQSNFVTRMTSDTTDKSISYTTRNSAFQRLKTIITQHGFYWQLWILLTIQVLINHVWAEVNCTWIEEGTVSLAKNLWRFVKSLPLDWIITWRESPSFSYSQINNLCLKIPKNIIFSYVNINLVRNKFTNVSSLISENFYIWIMAENESNSSCPAVQFLIQGFHHPFRLDINSLGCILVYFRRSIPARVLISFSGAPDTQLIVFEINLRKGKWLFVGIYKPLSLSIPWYLIELARSLF